MYHGLKLLLISTHRKQLSPSFQCDQTGTYCTLSNETLLALPHYEILEQHNKMQCNSEHDAK